MSEFNMRLLNLLFVLAVLTRPSAARGDETGPVRNLLLITADDLHWDSVGAFGCPIPGITPHLDRLAAAGVCLDHGHVTIAICQPTRAVWMTGRYPHRNGALGFDPIRPGVPTMLEQLHDAGFLTGLLAKNRHVLPSRKAAWDVSVPANELGIGRDPAAYYTATTRFLQRAAERGQRFFLMANAQDPHRPFAGSAQERARRETYPRPDRVFRPEECPVPGFLPDLPQVRREIAEYFTSVHRADQVVGAVLRALEESGQADQTLVMFLSDHGMALPFAKTNCYYHSTHTPWIVRWPGRTEAGTRCDALISGIDLAPTMLAAAGVEPLADCDGRSFLGPLLGQPDAERDQVITHINRTSGRNEYPMRSVITARYGYIYNGWSDGETRFRNESQNGRTMKAMIAAAESDPAIAARVQLFLFRVPEEFYDYREDPDALVNLIDDPDLQPVIADHRRRLWQHMQETGDPEAERFRDLLESSQP